MPLKKILLKPGVNRENTRYTTEGGWYSCDKIRFRQGTPEKIGGWQRISASTFLGVCRSLWNWVTLGAANLLGVGTHLKFYIGSGGAYYDITPRRSAVTLTNPFATASGSPLVTVTDANGGYIDGDFVSFYPSVTVNGVTIYGEYELTISGTNTYTINVGTNASSTGSSLGGTIRAVYQINIGPSFAVPLTGWGAGTWGSATWGSGQSSNDSMRIWSQSNFGEDLIFGPRGGGIYYWSAAADFVPKVFTATVASPTVITSTSGYLNGTPIWFYPAAGATLPTGITAGQIYYVRNVSTVTFNISATPNGALINVSGAGTGTSYIAPNAYLLSEFGDATDVPIVQNYLLVSDINRFVFAFGCNDYGATSEDPMLIRWCDQEDPYNWTPAATNQAGSLNLSRGSQIITAIQARQEVLVWTDSALYSLQYVGAPVVWGSQILGDNISIVGPNAVAYAVGAAFWMGKDKFYSYNGTVSTLNCDLRQYVFSDINTSQYSQIFAGTNEGFNEIWWFYCSAASTTIDRYVIYNYVENIWYYGNLDRTAWLDSGILDYPLAATYSNNLVYHESGVDDNTAANPVPITASITSSEFDVEDGDQFMFIRRVLPDLTFRNSTTASPSGVLTFYPLKNSGSGYIDPASVGGDSNAAVTRTATVPIESFTGQVYVRLRARQLAMKFESTGLGVSWQLGAMRLDIKPDGKASGSGVSGG